MKEVITYVTIAGLVALTITYVGLTKQTKPAEQPSTHKVEGHIYDLIHSDKCPCAKLKPLEE